MMLYPQIADFLLALPTEIGSERKELWNKLAAQMRSRTERFGLNFICTHNARRSAFSQVWAYTFSRLKNMPLDVYSGGAEATFIHPNTIATMKAIGFHVEETKAGNNPEYLVKFSDEDPGLKLFSKRFDDASSSLPFFAILVCSSSDKACPFIPQALSRNLIPFTDPGLHDQEPDPLPHYRKSAAEIAMELNYLFGLL